MISKTVFMFFLKKKKLIFSKPIHFFKAIAGKECPLSRRIFVRLQGAKAGA
jgi:hypothetical protein